MSDIGQKSIMPDFKWQVYHEAAILKLEVLPEEVTRRLGLTPTRMFRAGDPIMPGHSCIALISGWVLATQEREFDTAGLTRDGLSDLVALVTEFHDHLQVIRTLCPPAELRFKTIIATDSPNPGCGLSLHTARKVVELGATWEVSFWTGLST